MLFGPEQICVVFSQVFFLARADLGAHHEPTHRAELDGLGVDEAGLGRVFMIDVIMSCCCSLDGLLAMLLGDSKVLDGCWRGLHGLRDGSSPVVCLRLI